MPTLQLAKKKKLDHNANAERAERVKKRYELARGRTESANWSGRERRKLAESSLPVSILDRLQSEWKWREWGCFFFDQAAKAVTEGEEIEPKTLKDAECQTIEFHYMFQRSRYEAPNKNIFETDDIVRFYTVLPSTEIAMVVFEHIS